VNVFRRFGGTCDFHLQDGRKTSQQAPSKAIRYFSILKVEAIPSLEMLVNFYWTI
jgi:hypothetical protein